MNWSKPQGRLGGKHLYHPVDCKDLIETLLGRGPAPSRPNKPLTFRQREVLQLLAEGRAVKEIAVRLKISTRTVEFHKAHAMEQLGLRITAEPYQIRPDAWHLACS